MSMQQVMEDAAIDALVDSMELEGSGELVTFDPDTAKDIGQRSMYISSNAGKVPVWNIETGVRSDVLSTQLRSVLRTIFAADHPKLAGKRVYTLIEPDVKPRMGKLRCRLHPDHPDREFLDELGFRGIYCTKDNLVTQRQVGLHLRRSHKEVYETIKEHEERERQDAQIDLQKQMVDSLTAIRGGQPITQTNTCDECGKSFKTPLALRGHQRSHQ